jgi:hypothetical protein
MPAFAAAVLAAWGMFAGGAPVAGLVVIAGYSLWYGWSIKRRPRRRPCWRCKGRGWRGGLDPGNRKDGRNPLGRCWVCHDKAQVRWGVRVFMPATYAAIKAGRKGLNY